MVSTWDFLCAKFKLDFLLKGKVMVVPLQLIEQDQSWMLFFMLVGLISGIFYVKMIKDEYTRQS